MKITVLVDYHVRSINRERGNFSTCHAEEAVELEVPEAASCNAPVAVAWNDRPADFQKGTWGSYCEDGTGHTRWFGGRHYARLLDGTQGDPDGACPPLSVEGLERLAASADRPDGLIGLDFSKARKKTRVAVPFAERFPSAVASTRDEAIKAAERSLARFLVVDGTVYHACHEPMAIIRNARGGTARDSFIRIETDGEIIKQAMWGDPSNVAPVTRFDGLADLKGLFSMAAVAKADRSRLPEVLLDESIDEDAYLDAAIDVHFSGFLSAHEDCRATATALDAVEAIVALRRAAALPRGEERFEAAEAAIRLCVAAFDQNRDLPGVRPFDRMEEFGELADRLGCRVVVFQMDSPSFGGRP